MLSSKKQVLFVLAAAALLIIGITACSMEKTEVQMSSGKQIESAPNVTEEPPTYSPSPTPSASPPLQQPIIDSNVNLPTEHVNVVIIGSELEGLYLARAAADEGLTVKIIDPKAAFGGQVLQGQMLFLDETRDEHGKLLVQGKAKELFDGFRNGKIRKLSEFTGYMNKLISHIPIEPGIQIQDIQNMNTPNNLNSISSITYINQQHEEKSIAADYWVDNTDDAALLRRLDVKRLPGLEAFYGQKEIEYMSAGMMMKFKHVDWNKFKSEFNKLKPEQKMKQFGGGYVNDSFAIGLGGVTKAYKATNDRVFLRGLNAVNQRDGEVLINALLVYTVDPSNPQSVQEAVYLGNKETPLILNHFRKYLPGWEHADVNDLPAYPYIREYNHYEMDYTLQPSDLLSGYMFWDNVSIGGYPLDLQGTSANRWGIEMGRPDKYGMPLRSFLLKNYDNVIAAGKNVGSSAIAYGSTRIQPNTSLAAESIGVILGQIQGKRKLKELNEEDMQTLHQYLAEKYHIQLTGITGTNKISGWSEEEIAKLNRGEITYPSYVLTRKKKTK